MAESVVAELVDLLRLERLEDNLFRGQSRDIGTKYVFGGQVLGQALAAAQCTVDEARHVHSIHAYFLRAGTSGIDSWCSTPGSGSWNEDANTKIGWPCWIAVTRRTEKLLPSRERSTS